MRVDLPAPFSPTMAWTSAGQTSMFTSSLARTPGNDLVMPRSCTAGTVAACGAVIALPPRPNEPEDGTPGPSSAFVLHRALQLGGNDDLAALDLLGDGVQLRLD